MLYCNEGLASFRNCSFVDANANANGGIVHQAAGTLELYDCYLANSYAANGGALSCSGGTARVRRSVIAECTVGTSGGGVYITGALVEMEDSIVRDCTGSSVLSVGLAFFMSRVSRATVLRTLVVRCTGGSAFDVSGTLTFADGSSLRTGASALATAGFSVKTGARVSLIDASIVDCHVVTALGAAGGGAADVLEGGCFSLHNVVISGCTATYGAAAIDASSGATVRAAFLTIVPSCTTPAGVPMIRGDGNGSLLLRALSFEAAAGCDVSVATLAAGGVLVSASDLPDCATPGVCGVEAACHLLPVVASASASVATLPVTPGCYCEPPNAPHPGEPSAGLAAYTVGCATPRVGQTIEVLATGTTPELTERLQRTANGDTSVTRTLRLVFAGTAIATARWHINATAHPPWLHFEQHHGTIAALQDFVEIRVTLSTRGLPGSLEAYHAVVDVTVDSQLNTTLAFHVYFYVTSVDGRPCAASTWFVDGACRDCPPQFRCGVDATPATAELLPGFWRPGPNAISAQACANASSTSEHGGVRTSCKGGSSAGNLGAGYCIDANYTGALCAACALPAHHFDRSRARCVRCPNKGGRAFAALGIAIAIVIALAALVQAVRRPPRAFARSAAFLRRIPLKAKQLSLLPMLKVAFSFLQMVGVIPSLFKVTLPPPYDSIWDAFNNFEINFISVSAPVECFGDFGTRLLIYGLVPLVLMATVVVGCVAWSLTTRARENGDLRSGMGDAAMEGLLRALPMALFISFLLVPTVSKKIFSAFDCVPYDFDGGEESKSFLREDHSMLCHE